MSDDYDFLAKIILLGDSAVGKSNLLTRWTTDEFSLETKATIGVEFASKDREIHGKIIRAQVWDTAGQERFAAINSAYYRGALGAIIAYDTTKYNTFKNTEKWLETLREHGDPNIAVILVGNKIDLANLREVPQKEGKAFAERQGLVFVETSALNNMNVDMAFDMILEEIFSRSMSHREDHPWYSPLPSKGGGAHSSLSTNNQTIKIKDPEPRKKQTSGKEPKGVPPPSTTGADCCNS